MSFVRVIYSFLSRLTLSNLTLSLTSSFRHELHISSTDPVVQKLPFDTTILAPSPDSPSSETRCILSKLQLRANANLFTLLLLLRWLIFPLNFLLGLQGLITLHYQSLPVELSSKKLSHRWHDLNWASIHEKCVRCGKHENSSRFYTKFPHLAPSSRFLKINPKALFSNALQPKEYENEYEVFL